MPYSTKNKSPLQRSSKVMTVSYSQQEQDWMQQSVTHVPNIGAKWWSDFILVIEHVTEDTEVNAPLYENTIVKYTEKIWIQSPPT